ncbi:MAG TPA: ATP-binding protein [Gemmatimonas sp.]|nr:ATP-binding protein [Gemmatimonas sp.]
MGRWSSSVRARLTWWYTVVLSVPLVAFAVVSYLLFSRTLESRTDAFISDALTAFSRELVAERRVLPTLDDAFRMTVREVRFRDLDIVILDADLQVLAKSAPLGEDRAGATDGTAKRTTGRTTGRTTISTGPDTRVLVERLRERSTDRASEDRAGPGANAAFTYGEPIGSFRVGTQELTVDGMPYQLAGAYPLAEVEQTLARIRSLFLFAIPLLVLSASTGGYFLAKRSLAPVASMSARAAEIGASTLHERLPAESQDELGDLARTVNGLLDRLEASFAQQRRFMADASHELRTPTAILRTEADVTLSQGHRSESEYRESLAIMQDTARRLTRIVDDIFLLARADAGHLVMHPELVHLEDVVHHAMRGVRQLAERRQVALVLEAVVEAPLVADADLLGRVLLNLLDNAIKHSAPGDTVSVRMSSEGAEQGHAVTVADTGPGIPAAEWERVFERFVRLDSVRSRSENSATSGAGLGLGIARRIAEMHRGQLELVESRLGRTVFRLTVPDESTPLVGVADRA